MKIGDPIVAHPSAEVPLHGILLEQVGSCSFRVLWNNGKITTLKFKRKRLQRPKGRR